MDGRREVLVSISRPGEVGEEGGEGGRTRVRHACDASNFLHGGTVHQLNYLET